MEQRKGASAIGTTKRGIGPTYASKALRFGLRMGDLVDWNVFLEKYDKFVKEVSFYFQIEKFDKAKELDELKQLREKILARGMIVDSIEYMH